MKRDLSTVVVPFPKGLMSTARSPLTMPATFAREILNMLMAADGAGVKRNGTVAVGGVISGEVILSIMSFVAGGGEQLLVATDLGRIYRRNGSGWDLLYSGLSSGGTIRTVTFGGRLLLCNGVDDILAYDGSGWSIVSTFVTEAASGLTYVSATTFTVASDPEYYPVGSTVRATLGSGTVTAQVVSATLSGGVLTVVLGSSVLDGTLSLIEFTVKPPRAAYLAVAHDRLWAFGRGPLHPTMSSDVDRLRVYYTHGVNDWSAWPDPETGDIPHINLADKAGVADELMAMAVKDGMTVFMGRNHMQLWTGTDPTAEGDFAWSKTIPLGVVHGNAVLELPNDLLFISRQGARTLSRTLQTEQLDVKDVGGELDTTINVLLDSVLSGDAEYRRVVPLRQEAQGWLGLALHDRSLIWQIGAFGQGWVVFDGVFSGVTASHTTADGTLYLANGPQLYRYDTTAWSDAGAPIKTLWWMPWINPARTKRWAGKYVEVLVAPAVEVNFTLRRYRDYDDANPQVMGMTAPPAPDYWDTSDWDDALWDTGGAASPLARDHAVADSFAYAVESNSGEGSFTLFGIKLYGVAEQ